MVKIKILVLFYSMTGNTAKLARAIAKGAEETGAEVRLRQVGELIPEDKWNDEIKKTKKDLEDIQFASLNDLEWADGIAFGSPTRYGNMSAQLKEFIDETGDLWMEGKLIDKVACFFTSTATIHGGQESTILTSMIPMLHHGMIIIGMPYSEKALFRRDFGGGSPYGASSVGIPDETDLHVARALGLRLANTTKRLMRQ